MEKNVGHSESHRRAAEDFSRPKIESPTNDTKRIGEDIVHFVYLGAVGNCWNIVGDETVIQRVYVTYQNQQSQKAQSREIFFEHLLKV